MRQVVIENPVINSPFDEPGRHFRFADEGITNEVMEERRTSQYFVPIAAPRRKSKAQMVLPDTQWTQDRIEENKFINDIRARVALWRQRNREGVTRTTARLLEHWTRADRERRLFFCQIEALETAIYLTEIAERYGDAWIEARLREFAAEHNPDLHRLAFKMATGSGKTVVMAMLIAWHTLNKLANPRDARFGDSFLVVTPGITIRDRLRVLLPSDPEACYRGWDIVPVDLLPEMGKAKIVVTNFHAFLRRERVSAGKLTKAILRSGVSDAESPFTETPDQMVRRVCREFDGKRNVVIINDEAHHCYRRKPADDGEEKLTGDERREAKRRDEEARVWVSGLEAVKGKIGVRAVYDLSATPFFLKGSGYAEGTLFPWVVSDFSLIDAIECGIVKVPRVPVADDSMTGDQPTYRDLWYRIRDDLPKKGRGTEKLDEEPRLPLELEGALQSLYGNYKKYFALWEAAPRQSGQLSTPPVFIVVCNNTNVSKLVFNYIGGWDRTLPDGATVAVPGKLDLFSNVRDGRWLDRPNTILIDSQQLESGEAMSAEFKKIAAREIEEFKQEYRQRFPGRDAEALTDEDLLREVMNTVGKPGKLGEQVKCVVSVSMLTEGWDANTVTHILGVRAFGTQLLCEQVVGRGLRRISYATNARGMLDPEYAEVYGVPFSFIPSAGSAAEPRPGPIPTRVRALPERADREIVFPRLAGYRWDMPRETLAADFTSESCMTLSTKSVPMKVKNAPIVGQESVHTLDDLKERREQEVAFRLASEVLSRKLGDDEGNLKPWLFPQLLQISRRWLRECVTCKDDTFPQLLLFVQNAGDAVERIYQAIVASHQGQKTIKPILRPYDQLGSTTWVDFDTTRPTYETDETKCHVSHVVMHSDWEGKLAAALEDMDEVVSYVKNEGLNFTIPYTLDGEERSYYPDFIARLAAGNGEPVNLIVEVTGERKKEKQDKVRTAKWFWVPAVNNHGGFGRWDFLEITDPWDAKNLIRGHLAEARQQALPGSVA